MSVRRKKQVQSKKSDASDDDEKEELNQSSKQDLVLQLANETELVRTALFWLSLHPEITPLASVIGKYATSRAMKMCLGPTLCHQCEQCLEYLGVSMGPTGVGELCNTMGMLVYREALKDPVQSFHVAMQGIQYISHAVDSISHLPIQLEDRHSETLANTLWQNKNVSPLQLLQQVLKIHQVEGWDEWLHVALPEIMQKLKKGAFTTQKMLQDYIIQVYNEWRSWGQVNAPLMANAKQEAAEALILSTSSPH